MKIGLFRPKHNSGCGRIFKILDCVEEALKPFEHFVLPDTQWKDCDVSINWGVYSKKHHGHTVGRKRILAKSPARIVIEQGYVKRENHFSFGWNGHCGRGHYCNEGSPPDRWNELGVKLLPWRQGDKILLCGQIYWDTAVQQIDYKAWVLKTIAEIKKHTDRTIVFRPHPLKPKAIPMPKGVEVSKGRSLEQDLAKAFATVSFNSTTGVDSVIAGVPSFAIDPGSMAWPVTKHNLKDIENPLMPDRAQWAYNLAYCQWTYAEIQQGRWWSQLNE